MSNYHCVEIWEERHLYFKKVHDIEHENGGQEVEISEEEFNKLKNIIEGTE